MAWTRKSGHVESVPADSEREGAHYPELGKPAPLGSLPAMAGLSMSDAKAAPGAWKTKAGVPPATKSPQQAGSGSKAPAWGKPSDARSQPALAEQPAAQAPAASEDHDEEEPESEFATAGPLHDVSVVQDSESMKIIQAKEWDEDNLRYACTLIDGGTSLKLAGREAGCMLHDLKEYYDHTWVPEKDDCSDSD